MAERKNLCALIPTEMHDRVCREREKLGMTNSDYVLKVLTEYYDMMENGGVNMKATEKGRERTLAFPVSEEFFQRVKRYLERETARTGRKLTQKDFVIGLIEAKLDEADREDAEAEAAKKAEIEAGGTAEDSQSADVEPATEEPESTQSETAEAAEDSQTTDAEPATEEPEDSESENSETAEDSQPADAEPDTQEPEDSESENGWNAEDSQTADAEPATEEPEDSESENGETAEDSQTADADPDTEEPEDSESENGKENEDNAE